MKTRILTGIVAIALLIPVLIFSDTVALPIMLALCSLIAVYEMLSCIKLRGSLAFSLPCYLAAAAFPFLIYFLQGKFYDINLIRQVAMATLMIGALYFFAVLTFSHGKYKLSDVAVCFFTVFYILAGFNSILVLRLFEVGGKYVYLTAFICAWVTDTFAYFCGMLFGRGGKHKLLPDVSPKKTVEGAVGGFVMATVITVLYGLFIGLFTSATPNYPLLILAGVLMSLFSMVGDLVASLVKRHYGIKDYSRLLPGHGGVLDRFDSNLAAAYILIILYELPFGFSLFN